MAPTTLRLFHIGEAVLGGLGDLVVDGAVGVFMLLGPRRHRPPRGVSMSSSTIGPTGEREVLDVAGTALSGEAIALHPGSPVEQVAADDWLIAVDVVVK